MYELVLKKFFKLYIQTCLPYNYIYFIVIYMYYYYYDKEKSEIPLKTNCDMTEEMYD